MSLPEYIELAEHTIDELFDAICEDELDRFVRVKDGRYVIEVDCGPAPTISGVGSILKENNDG